MSSLERRVDQILSSSADAKIVSDRISDVVSELIDSEAYGQLSVVLSRILAETSQHQVTYISRTPSKRFFSLLLILILTHHM
jgi:hypothetical protein